MRHKALFVLFTLFWTVPAARPECTDILVSKNASADGSTLITYSCDGEYHPHLNYTPATDHKPGDVYEIRRGNRVIARIPQPRHTWAVVSLMNEHQLAIGESTFEGRLELKNPQGALHYWTLMKLALQRARTAREAIQVMTGLVEKYGYASTGESFSIADPKEVWLLEMIGPSPGGKGAIWVARKIPDGYVCCHANKSRIGEFPLNKPDCLYSKNVIRFAVKKGWYDPKQGKPFRFCDVYCPAGPAKLRYTATRVWSILRRVAPSLHLSPDYHRGVKGAEPYPLWIKPDKKLTLHDVMGLMRDHYEGTPYNMRKGITAGPFGCPKRWWPITWKVKGKEGFWERSISDHRTGFSIVAQCRSCLPDPVGGVIWYGMDDTYTTCYIPLYCCIDQVPPSFTRGSLRKFTWDSAWWVFNFVANFACLKYSYMIQDIQKVQAELEGNFIALQPAVDQTALALLKTDPALMRRYLTDYCVSHGELVVNRWHELGEYLITKYNDGFVKDEKGRPCSVGYPDSWLKTVLQLSPRIRESRRQEKSPGK